MINESFNKLRSQENSRVLLINQKEAILKINKDLPNGKIKCFLCLNDNLKIEESISEENDNDLQSNFLKKRSNFYKKSNGETPKLISADKFITNLNINIFKNSFALISPCNCNKYAHIKCLTQFFIMNYSFQCKKCNFFYGISFQEVLLESKDKNLFKVILFAIIFFTIHFILLMLSILLFLNFFNYTEKRIFWGVILGSFITIVNLCFLRFSLFFINNIVKHKNTNLVPNFYNNIECTDSMRQIDAQKCEKICKFLKQKNKLNKFELIERKVNNLKFAENIACNSKKMKEIIDDHNYLINNNTDCISPKINKRNLFNFLKPIKLKSKRSSKSLLKLRTSFDKINIYNMINSQREKEIEYSEENVNSSLNLESDYIKKITQQSNKLILNENVIKSEANPYAQYESMKLTKDVLNNTLGEIEEELDRGNSIDTRRFIDLNSSNFQIKHKNSHKFNQDNTKSSFNKLKKISLNNISDVLNLNKIKNSNSNIITNFYNSKDKFFSTKDVNNFSQEKLENFTKVKNNPKFSHYKKVSLKENTSSIDIDNLNSNDNFLTINREIGIKNELNNHDILKFKTEIEYDLYSNKNYEKIIDNNYNSSLQSSSIENSNDKIIKIEISGSVK